MDLTGEIEEHDAGAAAPSSTPRAPLQIVGAFESTFLPAHDTDVAELTRHAERWRNDLALLRACGVTRLRYPIRWHRIEREPGRFDWAETDAILEHMRASGMAPIVDLVHHTSYPAWLHDGFADERFGDAYLRYAETFAQRYPWIAEYTLFNEPFATLFLAGHEAIWPPYGAGMSDFVELLRNVVPPLVELSRRYRAHMPEARHVYVDTCEHHVAGDAASTDFVDMVNDRRFFVLDTVLGLVDDVRRPFVADLLAHGGRDLLDLEPGHVDVLGLDYYAHSEYRFTVRGGEVPSPTPVGLAALAQEYSLRYRLPMMLSETNIRGYASDRVSWMKYTVEQCELARAAGVPLDAYCWFPFVDSCDWDTLLARADGSIDPVGVYWLDSQAGRNPSSMSIAYARLAAGEPSATLPAYTFMSPVREQISGFLPQMAHWVWEAPPAVEVPSSLEDRCAVVAV